ncbi:HK97-gp10 family putative phage morphogenesis protein [Clostridium intestinale]|uniref:HK97-gp10 family putative phage morphogenesis protein n=1 Tax=Clostridium intestinale TaxID=36845 RepID=UPI0028EA4678|nr:HK97-gp10 family putative phage morphogenesis protein [Clostridium intestinale]
MATVTVTGLKELIKKCEQIATPKEIEKTEYKALERCGDLVDKELEKTLPVSKQVFKSGRKGSRTFKHSKDEIPMSIKKVKGNLQIVIGWEKSDNSPYFYMKFIEFGTSQQPPVAPFKKAFIKQRKEWTAIFIEEYSNLLESLNK